MGHSEILPNGIVYEGFLNEISVQGCIVPISYRVSTEFLDSEAPRHMPPVIETKTPVGRGIDRQSVTATTATDERVPICRTCTDRQPVYRSTRCLLIVTTIPVGPRSPTVLVARTLAARHRCVLSIALLFVPSSLRRLSPPFVGVDHRHL